MTLDVLIIGGGLHGTMLSHHLTTVGMVKRSKVRVLDPFEEPAVQWKRHSSNTGMEYMRSASVFHIDVDQASLDAFMSERGGYLGCSQYLEIPGDFGDTLDDDVKSIWRPSLSLFNNHTAHIIDRYGLRDLRVQGKALTIKKRSNAISLRVETDRGFLRARKVVLALGLGKTNWPEWAYKLKTDGGKVSHVFDDDFNLKDVKGESVAIVGGGISAGQLAVALTNGSDSNKVYLLSRSEIDIRELDAEPAYANPNTSRFRTFLDYGFNDRHLVLERVSNEGTMPNYVFDDLDENSVFGDCNYEDSVAIKSTDSSSKGKTRLNLERRVWLGEDEKTIEVDRVILATGFEKGPQGGELFNNITHNLGLPIFYEDGFPMVGDDLHWGKGVYCMGQLGKYALGPFAANLIGARIACQQLVRQF